MAADARRRTCVPAMQSKTLNLPEWLLAALEAEAARRGVSFAELARALLEAALARETA